MAPPVNRLWAQLVTEEFHLQVEMERKLSLPVSSALDAHTELDRINMQIGFLSYIVLPRWRSLSSITAGEFADLVEQGELNCDEWKAKAKHATSDVGRGFIESTAARLQDVVGAPCLRPIELSDDSNML
eukprot:GHVS01013276.1.p1 GENE.GHVS01013276.1~~GHVS01013276.1.p1  ORF type:complete len:129 (-),score=30.52 GHVS01013276.1:243-629(-)